MKLLILSLVLSFNVLAGAEHIGDFANFEFSQDGSVGEYSVTVKQFKDSKYTIEAITKIGNQSQVQFDPMSESELMTHQKALQILEYCSQIGGTPENLVVRSRSYNTCKLPAALAIDLGLVSIEMFGDKSLSTDSAVWAGDVPVLGVIKMVNAGFLLNLVSAHWN